MMVRHRPFTKDTYPAGEMPDMQPESEAQEAKIMFAKEALAESFRANSILLNDMKVIEFRLSNVTTERDVALAEVERLKANCESYEQDKNAWHQRALAAEHKLRELDDFNEVDKHLSTGG